MNRDQIWSWESILLSPLRATSLLLETNGLAAFLRKFDRQRLEAA
jgi:hypothetical protein